jgi:hypothetical protein
VGRSLQATARRAAPGGVPFRQLSGGDHRIRAVPETRIELPPQ